MKDISDRIEKLLALAGNNPSREEASAALEKARELMARHNIKESSLNLDKNKIVERISNIRTSAAWKRATAALVAQYFRCKSLYYSYRGKQRIGFFGYEDDCEAALKIFEYLLKHIDKLATNYVKENYNGRRGLKGDYIFGFLTGLMEVFEDQKKAWASNSETMALALITEIPSQVLDEFEKSMEGCKEKKFKGRILGQEDSRAISAGFRAGHEFGETFGKSIEVEAMP
jgi:hypothetical protein